MSLKASILALASTALAPVAVTGKEMPDGLFVRKLSINERENYGEKIKKAIDNHTVNATAFVLATCDETGKPIFGEVKDNTHVVTDADISEAGGLPSKFVLDVLEFFNKVNGFDKEIKKAVDDAEKN